MDVNYNGTVNILEAIRKYSKDTIIHIPGSGEEYGDIKQEQLPITLDTVMNPVNPYAVSKVAQDLISYVYHESYGINVVRTRAFNHEGPRRLNVFGLPWYAYQIALIVNQEQQPILTTGHTGDKRNFTHVSDMVNAYYLSTQLCDFGKLYLVGNNNPEYECTFREGLEMLINASKIDKKIEIVQDERWVRPTNVPFLIADCSEFVNKTNWVPKKNLQTIIEDTMEYWLQNYKKFPSLNLVSSVKPLMEN
jgi:GDP-D-mannose dehydratase